MVFSIFSFSNCTDVIWVSYMLCSTYLSYLYCLTFKSWYRKVTDSCENLVCISLPVCIKLHIRCGVVIRLEKKKKKIFVKRPCHKMKYDRQRLPFWRRGNVYLHVLPSTASIFALFKSHSACKTIFIWSYFWSPSLAL